MKNCANCNETYRQHRSDGACIYPKGGTKTYFREPSTSRVSTGKGVA